MNYQTSKYMFDYRDRINGQLNFWIKSLLEKFMKDNQN
jgi:hypothetical protein